MLESMYEEGNEVKDNGWKTDFCNTTMHHNLCQQDAELLK